MKQKSLIKTMVIAFVVVMLSFVIAVDGMFYFSARQALLNDQQQEIEMLMDTIKTSIESTQQGEILFEEQLADQLRMASIAAQNALPKKLKDVTTEQLVELKNQLSLQDLTLFQYLEKEDDFEAVKSSNPNEIGLRTGKWSNGNWNKMFKGLMTVHNVTPIENFGEYRPSFWAGPYDTQTTDPTQINKWGYYNDGTTDYLIDPIISSSSLFDFQNTAGVNAYIKSLVDNVESLNEIAVINDKILQGEWEAPNKGNVTWHSERMVLYGTYKWSSEEDLKMAKRAFDNNTQEHAVLRIHGHDVLKSYIPIDITTKNTKGFNRMIFITTSDMRVINSEIKDELGSMLIVALLSLIVGGIGLWASLRYINRQNKVVHDVENMYSANINSLFKTIKEHRHDFNNHIYTLTGLCGMKKFKELEEYLMNLSNIHTAINDIININIPAFCGLIQAKVAYASETGIVFEHHFEGFENVDIGPRKVTDMVRVVGNIIDNAFYAVRQNEHEVKQVAINGSVKRGVITFQIMNNGSPIPGEYMEKIFEHGFSTKPKTNNSGLGLAIVKEILEGYKGNIMVTSDEQATIFTIRVPITSREFIQEPA